jgi:hypothetical protein
MQSVPGFEMIQINTDGLTVRIPRKFEWLLSDACEWWQTVTGLELERADYRLMHIRDVNNYIAIGTDGKLKRKGAYETLPPGERTPVGWHQDTSAMVVPKAAEYVVTSGGDVDTFIRAQADPFDFMCRAKVPRGSRLMHGETEVQGTSRYYVSTDGQPLAKVSPPPDGMPVGQYKRAPKVGLRDYLEWHRTQGNVWNADIHTKNRSVYEERRMQICAGWLTSMCNRADAFRWDNVNYEWYVTEAKKLLF